MKTKIIMSVDLDVTKVIDVERGLIKQSAYINEIMKRSVTGHIVQDSTGCTIEQNINQYNRIGWSAND